MATGGGEGREADVSGRCCGVCGERYRRPKLLPCLHSYCQSCLQALAGTAPSVSCPACRVCVLLPPGGIPALQTNQYIMREQSLDSTAPARLCDVCTEDREAAHCCVQCRQRYCARCRDVHDSISSCSSHTVVAVQAESQGEVELQWDDPGQEELCPKHQDQRLVLRCVPCRANICLRCKLTTHETHSVDNLRDLGSKVKARLQERLQALDHQASAMQGVLSAVRDRQDRLGAAYSSTEQGVRDRALKVKQLVEAAQDSTVGSLQAVIKDLTDSLVATQEGVRRRHAALTAQTQHITRMLCADNDADLVDLEDRLNQMSLDPLQGTHGLGILQTEAEPYLCQHNPLAISAAQLQEFVGVLKMMDDKTAGAIGDSAATPGASDTLSPGQTQSVSWSEQQSVTIQEVVYSRNPKSTVVAICSTSKNKVWIKYKPSGEGDIMALFDNQGLVQNALCDFPAEIFVTIPNDITLGLYSSKGSCFIDRSGYLIENSSLLQQSQYFKTLSSVSKTCHGSTLYGTNDSKCYTIVLILAHMCYTCEEVFHNEGLGCLKAVSQCEKYFVFGTDDGAHVYVKTQRGHRECVKKMFTYRPAPTQEVLDACFFPVGGRELLVVLVEGDRQLHVVDHTDGCHFLHYLDTGHFTLDNPRLLATDQESALWVACDGGKVLSIQVTDTINPATPVSVNMTSWCTVM